MSFQNPKARVVGRLKRMGFTAEEIAEQLRIDSGQKEIQRGPTRDNERPTPPDIGAQIREERKRRIPEKVNNINDIRKAIQALTDVVKKNYFYGIEGESNLRLISHSESDGQLNFAELQIDGEINKNNKEENRLTFVYIADTKETAYFTRQRLERIISIEGGGEIKPIERRKEVIKLPEGLKGRETSILLEIDQNREKTEAMLLHEWRKPESRKVNITMRQSGSFPKVNGK